MGLNESRFGVGTGSVGYAGALTGMAITGNQPEPTPGEINAIRQSIEELNGRLSANVAHLHSIADRLFGPVPQKPGAESVKADHLSDVGRVHDALSDAHRLAGLLADATDRLSRL